jgi:hypothetical protein
MGPSRFTSHPTGRCAADFYGLTITKINILTLFKEIIAENHSETSTK